MSEFGELWEHQKNPASIKNVRVFIMKLVTLQKKKKKNCGAVRSDFSDDIIYVI